MLNRYLGYQADLVTDYKGYLGGLNLSEMKWLHYLSVMMRSNKL